MKTLRLTPCRENKFPDIPDLRFYRTEGDLFYFDATHCLSKGRTGIGYSIEEFLTRFDHLIDSLCMSNGIAKEELAVQDDSGRLFLEESLAIPFMVYIDPWFGPYIIERMEELVRYGFTISDHFCRFFSQTRFGDDAPRQITGQ